MTTSAEAPAQARIVRHDGWTPDRRRAFLEALAEGHTVEAACSQVGMSRVTAYALRRRDSGFALAWSAAALRARDAIADTLTSRAVDGQVETLTRSDGTIVTRHRYDNRLGLALLARLDRLAAQPVTSEIGQPHEAAARGAAYAFDALLALVEEGELDADAVAAFVEPQIRKLRKFCRGDAILEAEEAVHETDYFDNEEHRETRELCKLRTAEPVHGPADDPAVIDDTGRPRIWYSEGYSQYQTDLSPPAGFSGYQHGRFGDPTYWRVLTPGEIERQKQRERDTSGWPALSSPLALAGGAGGGLPNR